VRSSAPFLAYSESRSLAVEFLPGKRALAIGLCIYHSVASTILYQAPRFIPHSFGPAFESYVSPVYSIYTISRAIHRLKITPEVVWGTLHGVLGLAMVVWWQGTLAYAAAARKAA